MASRFASSSQADHFHPTIRRTKRRGEADRALPFEMNLSPTKTRDSIRIILLVLLAFGVGLAAITTQSLWMDEGSGAFKALMPNFKDWWAMTLRLGGSDVQMPVYMFLLWGWAQLGALSEFALRAMNLPWLIVSVLALRKVRFWPLVCLTCPFILYYTGELRPYAMQIAAGALAAAALAKVIAHREEQDFSGLHAAGAAALLLCGSSLTAVIWAGGLWLGVLMIRPDWLVRREFWIKSIPWIIGSLLFGAYYTFTLIQGYRATGNDCSSVLSVFFGGYEMIGLLGLGPSKNELRASPLAVMAYLGVLVPAFLCIAGAWVYGVRWWLRMVPFRSALAVGCAVLLPVIFLSIIGILQNFQVLGRHLSPVVPAVLLPIALTLSAGIKSKFAVILGSLAVLFMLASSVQLRFLERYARDDYRTATNLGITALKKGKAVLWQADMNATRYYAYRQGGIALVNTIQILESDPPSSFLVADVVVINRPDLRYPEGNHYKQLQQNYFKLGGSFTGFEIWDNSY